MGKLFIAFFFLSLLAQRISAQDCTADYFSVTYEGGKQQFVKKTIRTAENEIVTIGYTLTHISNATLVDAWVAKYTGQGNIIWSREYKSALFDRMYFTDIAPAENGSFLLVGMAVKMQENNPNYDGADGGLLFKIDKQGHLVWSKSLFYTRFPPVLRTYIENIVQMKDGDYVLNVVYHNATTSQRSKSIIMRINGSGGIKWETEFYSDTYTFDFNHYKSITQLRNGNIVVGSYTYERDWNTHDITRVSYHLLALDYSTGTKLWDKGFSHSIKRNSSSVTDAPIQHITELPDGKLSLFGSLSDSSGFSVSPYAQKSVNIITDANGNLLKAVGYFNARPGFRTKGVVREDNGEQTVLLYDGYKPFLMRVDKDGNILWQHQYGKLNYELEPASLLRTEDGYYISANGRATAFGITQLFKTEKNGSIECLESPVAITAAPANDLIREDKVNMYVNTLLRDTFTAITAYSQGYAVTAAVNCRKACCTDVIDSEPVRSVTLCEGKTYTLPDGTLARDSGTYYLSYKTAKGCDSIVYYQVNVLKDPQKLQLGGELCLEGKDTVTLKASGGFEQYLWMSTASPDSVYKVTKPGIYWVGVNNACGSKKDSVQVYDRCDLPLYMPNAFTPNGDGLNDLLKVPPQNPQKLIRFIVYNRWGQKVFETNNRNRGWDGTFRGKPQPEDVYVYIVVAENVNKKIKTVQGTVVLVR